MSITNNSPTQPKIVVPEAESKSKNVLERFSDDQSESDYDDFARCSGTPSIKCSSPKNTLAELGFRFDVVLCCLPIRDLKSCKN